MYVAQPQMTHELFRGCYLQGCAMLPRTYGLTHTHKHARGFWSCVFYRLYIYAHGVITAAVMPVRRYLAVERVFHAHGRGRILDSRFFECHLQALPEVNTCCPCEWGVGFNVTFVNECACSFSFKRAYTVSLKWDFTRPLPFGFGV